jgi:hypothetical protein
MKKVLIIFLFISFFVFFLPSKTSAAGWTEVFQCIGGQYSPDQIISYIKSDNPDSIIQNLKSNQICARNDVNLFEISEITGNTIHYCKKSDDLVVMKNFDGKYEKTCCPRLKPIGIGNFCCPAKATGYYGGGPGGGQIGCIIPGETDRVPATGSSPRASEIIDDDIQVFTKQEKLWQCPVEDCLMSVSGGTQTLLSSNSTLATPLTLAQRASYGCQPKGSNLTGMKYSNGSTIPDDMLCAFQNAVDQTALELIDVNTGIQGCLDLPDDEKKRCFDCFAKNINPDDPDKPQTFVYSSIGCIDTGRDAFITRLFQLGFGTLSGLSVFRIMWGAVKRQSTDPAKIQEGRDMIWSAITALIMLAAAIPILRYIGINLLGVLPFGFLN